MSTARTDALSAADSAWWHMDRPTNPMVITAVLTFRDPLPFERVVEIFRARFLAYPRFRQRLDRRPWPGGLRWVDDASFSLERHLLRTALPPPGDRDAMQALVSDLMSSPLDPARPLWQFHFIEEYRGGSALVGRIHHCIADGIALIRVLLTLDDLPGNESAAATWWEKSHRPAGPAAALPGGRVRRLARGAATGARTAGAAAVDLVRLAFMRFDPPTPLHGALVPRKLAAWSEPFPLARVQAIGRATSATVHDVLAATAAGGLRTYLAERGRPARRGVRAVVPVNLRAAADAEGLGNRFGLVFLPLPLEVADPVERVRDVERAMRRLKRSPEPVVIYALLTLFGRALRPLLGLVVYFLGRKATLVMTDVPGPREPVTFGGSRLDGLMAWVPQSGDLGLGISLLSYAGELRVGVAADASLVPDPDAVIRACERALRELEARVVPAPAGVG